MISKKKEKNVRKRYDKNPREFQDFDGGYDSDYLFPSNGYELILEM